VLKSANRKSNSGTDFVYILLILLTPGLAGTFQY